MYTLVLASQKGGSGKTTLSGHLSVEAERIGDGPVALIDTDPQGSLAEWWNVRESKTPIFVKVGSMDLENALNELRSAGIQLAIVDTPPAITGAIAKVVSCADLVLVPTRPGPHDLRAIGATVDIAEGARKPLVFVINDATARARITSDAAVALSQHGTVAPVMLHHRVDFAASMVDGRTVGEIVLNSNSAKEITTLWAYISERLKKIGNDTDIVTQIRPRILAHQRPALVIPDEIFAKPEDIVAAQTFNADETIASLDPLPSAFSQPELNADEPKLDAEESRSSDENNRTARRSSANRPMEKLAGGKFRFVERRNANPFGRRKSDQVNG